MPWAAADIALDHRASVAGSTSGRAAGADAAGKTVVLLPPPLAAVACVVIDAT